MNSNDFDNSSGEEEFHEDALNNEEYDLLYELLPKVREEMEQYNSSIANFPESQGKISKLALLAKKRAASNNPNKSETNVSIAVSNEDTTGNLSEKLSVKPKLSKLAMLASNREHKSLSDLKVEKECESPAKALLVRKPNTSGLNLRKRAVELRSHRQKKLEQKPSVDHSNTDVPVEKEGVPDEIVLKSQHDTNEGNVSVSFHCEEDRSLLLQAPQGTISVFLFNDSKPAEQYFRFVNKRRKLASELFHAYTNRFPNLAKARSNFSSPSPDDKVLEAQKQAFEKDMNNLAISEKPKEKKKKIVTETKPFKKIDLAKELASNPIFKKSSKSFVIIGHVDAGKSTLMGRILYDLGTVDAKTVNKLVREAEKSGKGSFALAWIMDQTSEERSRGVTIDICATSFETPTTRFTAIDAPGHKDFVPQLIGGVSQADIALLVVDAINGEFEAGFVMDGQTKEHTLIVKNLGIEKLCVAVNKMDKENWSEERYLEIKEQLMQFLTGEEVGFAAENISFVPISGLAGINVVKNDGSVPELSWYKGPTLIDYLEAVNVAGHSSSAFDDLSNAEFNLAINDIESISNTEFRVKGKISSGIIQAGNTVCAQPSEDYLLVQSVLLNGQNVDVAVSGQIVQLTFKASQLKNTNVEALSIGDLLVSANSSVRAVKSFHANVNMFNMSKPLLVGTPFVLFRNNASVAARISKIEKINGSKKKKMHLVAKQSAEVIIQVLDERALPIAKFNNNKSLGRVVIRREGSTIGAGVVTDF
ncbi:Hsp70 suppressor, GTPase facilitates ribosomal subunit dissociation [Clavispora lusitaniae]|nr:Hsp70 suppressor, GTPase facilitates ribosomal subunit dissociation [Clavispora lusitaniae]